MSKSFVFLNLLFAIWLLLNVGGTALADYTCTVSNRDALQAYPADLAGSQAVDIQADGAISVTQAGDTYYSQLAAQVVAGTPPPKGLLKLTPIDDANSDGIKDFQITYPSGDQQILYYFGTTPPLQIKITSPVANATITAKSVLVEGTHNGPPQHGHHPQRYSGPS